MSNAQMVMNERGTKAVTMWPLLFTYKSPVFGKGFIADVKLCGRLLAELEADGVWLYGVNPGGFAATAPTLALAGPEVTTVLSTLFVDFAEEANTFDAFKAQVQRFFDQTDDETLSEWKAAVDAVRSGALAAPPGLPIESADAPCTVSVTSRPITQVTPQDNAIVIAEQQNDKANYALAAAA
jgi:hypothetical protein